MTNTKPQIHVLIVGAGLGGLAAAVAIRKNGHKVTILEQATQLGEVGAGIQIPPNSSRLLIRWGLKEKFEAKSIRPESFILRSYKDVQELSKQPVAPYTDEVYGYPYWHIHRADFHALMVEEVQRLGIEIKLNARTTNIDFEEPSVTLATGEVITGDLVIGADGLKSKCRELFLGKFDPPHLTGDFAYRIFFNRDDMRKHPELDFLSQTPQINYWMGPDSHVVLYMLRGGEAFNAVIICPDNLPPDVNIFKTDISELHTFFKGWDPVLTKLLSLVKEDPVKWRLQNSREMKSWVHKKGKFALLGDACHSTLPYLAQGAAQAVEDGAVLGGLLGKLESKEQIHDILEIYEALRKKRTTQIVQSSTDLQSVFHLHDGREQKERDRILTQTPPHEGYPNRWADPVFQRFMFGYDADKEIERGWEYYKSGFGTNAPSYKSEFAVIRNRINGKL